MKIALAALLASASPALGQSMDHSMHHPVPQPEAAPAHDHAMAGMDMPTPAAEPQGAGLAGTDQPPGNAAPPRIANDRAGDLYWSPAAMAAAEASAMQPPLVSYGKITFDLAERQFRRGKDGYRWEAEAWFGDMNRIVIKSKGEATNGEGLDRAEVQALYAKALDPWWNLQLGVRHDIRPRPTRTWASLGVEGRAPYQFDVQAAAFLSDKGQLAARIEGAYDQRITQALILQPRVEFDLSLQDMTEQRIGSGLSTAELGLRLRYEIVRECAPYIGINWVWAVGQTADYARADGKDASERSVVAGIRFWF